MFHILRPTARRSRQWLIVALAVLLTGVLPVPVLAQGGAITYGTAVAGSITEQASFLVYQFNGGAGDEIIATVVGMSAGMSPGLSLLGSNQRQLALADSDPFGAEGVARLAYLLPDTGRYYLMVTNTAGTPGDFVLHLDGRAVIPGGDLQAGDMVGVDLPAGSPPASLNFTGLPGGLSALSIAAITPDFPFIARLYGPDGGQLGEAGNERLNGATFILRPGGDRYTLIIGPLGQESAGQLSVNFAAGGSAGLLPPALASPTPIVAAPTLPPVVQATPTPSTCQVSSTLNVNVRTGPGTNYPAIGSLFPGTALNVIGRNNESTWFVVNYNGQQGWVASSVVQLGGPCGNLPVLTAPPPPTPVPPPTPTISFTVDGGASANITSGQCVTVAWNTANVREVYYQNTGVPGVSSSTECPTTSQTYTLRVVLQDGSETTRQVSVNVSGGSGALNPGASPNYGIQNVTGGFLPDPITVSATSGGSVNVSYLGGACVGYASSNPDYAIVYNSPWPSLKFFFVGGGDTTLVIRAPNGTWYCNDDGYGGLNPQVLVSGPPAGRYDIWIGSYSSGNYIGGTLNISELP